MDWSVLHVLLPLDVVVLDIIRNRAHNTVHLAGIMCWLQCASERSQWPMSSSVKSNILTKANLHTYVELCEV